MQYLFVALSLFFFASRISCHLLHLLLSLSYGNKLFVPNNITFREKRLAKKYYDKLFKEYCISDLSRYKENKVCFEKIFEKSIWSNIDINLDTML